MALSERVRKQLEAIACIEPGDVHSYGSVRVGCDDALRLLEAEEIYCVIETLVGAGFTPKMIKKAFTSDGVETFQLVKREVTL